MHARQILDTMLPVQRPLPWPETGLNTHTDLENVRRAELLARRLALCPGGFAKGKQGAFSIRVASQSTESSKRSQYEQPQI